jgi:hypothetical protein
MDKGPDFMNFYLYWIINLHGPWQQSIFNYDEKKYIIELAFDEWTELFYQKEIKLK